MDKLKKRWIHGLLLGLLLLIPVGVTGLSAATELAPHAIENAAIQYGHRRPFNWYYPYSYRYYYPRPHYTSTSSQCYWTNVNGTFVYTCS